jgi:hypothetical protein
LQILGFNDPVRYPAVRDVTLSECTMVHAEPMVRWTNEPGVDETLLDHQYSRGAR